MDKLLHISGSPHVHSDESVKKIMWSVVLALVPALLVSVYYFGLRVIILTLVSIGSCVLFEYLIQRFMLHQKPSVDDGSAVVTGLLLAFNVPSNLPIWIMVVGALVAIGIAKMPFGGLGHNPFNPALVARVTLLIAFPVQMTTWPVPTPIWGFADAVRGWRPDPNAQLRGYAYRPDGRQLRRGFRHRPAHRCGVPALEAHHHLAHSRVVHRNGVCDCGHFPLGESGGICQPIHSSACWRSHPRCLFHGHRYGDLSDLPVGYDRVRLRLRSAHHHYPSIRRIPGGCLLLHPADERCGAVD